MTHRRFLATLAASLFVSTALAQTQPAVDAGMDAMLDRLNVAGQTLTSLRADVTMQTTDNFGGNSQRTGTILLQRRGEGDTRGRVNLDTFITGDKVIRDRLEYLLDGDWVTDRVYRRPGDATGGNRETSRQIRAPGTKTDLLKLGAGPFPLPIGQPPEVVRQQFDVAPLPADDSKPGMSGLKLTPRATNDLGRRFKWIAVWLKPGDALPAVIETTDPEESTTQTTTLADVVVNGPVGDADFKLEPIDASWQVVREPFGEAKP